MLEFEFPAEIKTKVNAYNEHKESRQASRAKIQARADQLRADQELLQKELAKAVNRYVENPTDTNYKKEKVIREKLEVVESELSNFDDRIRQASIAGMEKKRKMALDAIQTAKTHAYEHYEANRSEKLEAIQAARRAYIEALAGYHELTQYCNNVYHEAIRQTNPNVNAGFFCLAPVTERDYIVYDYEAKEAMNRGKVPQREGFYYAKEKEAEKESE